MDGQIKVAVAGASGRMGIALIRALSAHPRLELVACGIRPNGQTLASSHFEQAGVSFAAALMVDSADALLAHADAVIDFTSPAYSIELAQKAAGSKKILVSGTTGMSASEKEALVHASEHIPIVWSANMSIGVTLLLSLVEETAAILDTHTDIEIVEMHHRMKKDAPSGTALALGEAAAKGRGVALADVSVRARDGITGARKEGSIGFASLRGGDVVGDHSVIFASPGERIELAHKASSREIYARGALAAVEWAAHKPAGFYTMRDVIGR